MTGEFRPWCLDRRAPVKPGDPLCADPNCDAHRDPPAGMHLVDIGETVTWCGKPMVGLPVTFHTATATCAACLDALSAAFGVASEELRSIP